VKNIPGVLQDLIVILYNIIKYFLINEFRDYPVGVFIVFLKDDEGNGNVSVFKFVL